MHDYQVCITTYNRPEPLQDVLTDVRQELASDRKIVIVNDGGPPPPDSDDLMVINLPNGGKDKYWRRVDLCFKLSENSEGLIFLQDDIRLKPGILSTIKRVDKAGKYALAFVKDLAPRWGARGSRRVKMPIEGHMYEMNWLDCVGFFLPRRVLGALNYTILPISKREERKSSGVGIQISKRLRDAKVKILHPKESLISHMLPDSVMHPELRRNIPIKIRPTW